MTDKNKSGSFAPAAPNYLTTDQIIARESLANATLPTKPLARDKDKNIVPFISKRQFDDYKNDMQTGWSVISDYLYAASGILYVAAAHRKNAWVDARVVEWARKIKEDTQIPNPDHAPICKCIENVGFPQIMTGEGVFRFSAFARPKQIESKALCLYEDLCRVVKMDVEIFTIPYDVAVLIDMICMHIVHTGKSAGVKHDNIH